MISGNKPVEFIFTFESELNVDVLWPYIADTNLLAKFGGGENMLRWMVDYMEKIPDPILVRRFSIS